MLGMHGIRYGIKHPEILKAELNAMKRVSEKGKKLGILSPQIVFVSEIQAIKKVLNEIGFTDAKVGVMVETPASVQIIKELCEEKIDFISFGTNDLTQYTLAIDRGNQEVQSLYNELDPSVLHQIEHVIKVCKQYNVETSICGQAGSKKDMVKFLVEKGIDSITVNADVAADISNYVLELEGGTVAPEPPKEPAHKQEEDNVNQQPNKSEQEVVNVAPPVEEAVVEEKGPEKEVHEKVEEATPEPPPYQEPEEELPNIPSAQPVEEEHEEVETAEPKPQEEETVNEVKSNEVETDEAPSDEVDESQSSGGAVVGEVVDDKPASEPHHEHEAEIPEPEQTEQAQEEKADKEEEMEEILDIF